MAKSSLIDLDIQTTAISSFCSSPFSATFFPNERGTRVVSGVLLESECRNSNEPNNINIQRERERMNIRSGSEGGLESTESQTE